MSDFPRRWGRQDCSSPSWGKCPEGTKGGQSVSYKSKNSLIERFSGYAGWNTSANTLGSLLAEVKVRYNAKKYNEQAFKKLQMTRFLDDRAYQANVRAQIEKHCDITELIKPYEECLSETFKYEISNQIIYSYPWNRKFEVEVRF